MNAIIFANLAGIPIASLLMSAPATPDRSCTFVAAPVDRKVFDSREGQVLLPDRPSQYPCRYQADHRGIEVTFENQNGWRFQVKFGSDADGTWSAQKDGEQLEGLAHGL